MKISNLFRMYNLKTWQKNRLQIFLNIFVISITIAAITTIQIVARYQSDYAFDHSKSMNGGDIKVSLGGQYISDKISSSLDKLKEEGYINYSEALNLKAVIRYKDDNVLGIIKFIDNPKYNNKESYTCISADVNKTLGKRLGLKKNCVISFSVNELGAIKRNYKVKNILNGDDSLEEEAFGTVIADRACLNNIISDNVKKSLKIDKMRLKNVANTVYINVLNKNKFSFINNRISKIFEDEGNIRTVNDVMKIYKNSLSTQSLMLDVVGIFAFIVSGISLITTFLLLIIKRQKDFGIFKTFGLKNKELSNLIMFEGFIVGIISDSIGIVMALLISNFAVKTISESLNILTYAFDLIPAMLFSAILGILMCVIFIRVPIALLLKIKPIAIFRQQTIAANEKIEIASPIIGIVLLSAVGISIAVNSYLGIIVILFVMLAGALLYLILSNLLMLISKLKFIKNKTIKLSLMNIGRQKKLFSVTIISMICGLSLISTVVNITSNSIPLVYKKLVGNGGYNITMAAPYGFEKEYDKRLPEHKKINRYTKALVTVGTLLKSNSTSISTIIKKGHYTEEDKAYAKSIYENANIEGLTVSKRMFKYEVSAGRWLIPSDKNKHNIIIGDYFADNFKLYIGSHMLLKINGRNVTFKVIGIKKKDYFTDDQSLYTDIGSIREIINGNHINSLKDNMKLEYLINVSNNKELSLTRELSSSFRDAQVMDMTPVIKAINDFFMGQINVFIYISIMCIAASVFLMSNLMLISFLQRQKEFTLIKIMGAKNRDLRRIVLFEVIITGLVGGIFTVLVSESLNAAFVSLIFKVKYSPSIAIISCTLGIGLLISMVSSMIILPGIKIKELNSLLRTT